jgi:MurNAc alpha-1-phosphate uridylyltransferase
VDGMILAAGLGTRLGALGATTPKALIEIAGVTMLERTARRLADAGVDRIVVNVHHHAAPIERHLAGLDLGAEVVVSREEERPLETGGGLLHARRCFRGDRPILVHNVDVVTDADLRALLATHAASEAVATLAVSVRETARQLLFDDGGLTGREDRGTGTHTACRATRGVVTALAFAGIHVCAPRLFDLLTERGAFPIVDAYLRLAGEGHVIAPWRMDGSRWLEIGSTERLAAARAALEGPGGA